MGMGLPQMLVALMYSEAPPRQVVLAGSKDRAGEMLQTVRTRFLPNTTVVVVDDPSRAVLSQMMPALVNMQPVDGRVTAYVCENFTCQLPTTEVAKLAELLQ